MRDMKYYIYTCESDGSEAPLTMIDGKIIEFETEARADAFLNELKHSSIFDEESEEFKQLTSKAFIKSAIVFCDDGYIDADAAEMGAFGYIISEKVRMTEKIEELLNKFYFNNTNKEYNIYGFEDSPYEDIRVDEAINKLFRENGFNEKSYSSQIIEVFETSYSVYCAIAIAWIECGELRTYNVPFYYGYNNKNLKIL